MRTMQSPGSHCSLETWSTTKAFVIDQLRREYVAEVERFAETLRPRFEAGEFYASRNSGAAGQTALGKLVIAHFGLAVATLNSDGRVWHMADDVTVHVILAVSDSTDETSGNWIHAAHHAAAAATWDVVAHARRRGWYAPTTDEIPHPAHVEPGCYCEMLRVR